MTKQLRLQWHGMLSLKDLELIQNMDVNELFTLQNGKLTDYVKCYQEHHWCGIKFIWMLALNQFDLLSDWGIGLE